ncbi:unnamed protein product, partial [Allacma fusca]
QLQKTGIRSQASEPNAVILANAQINTCVHQSVATFIHVPALGRAADIGHLYNVITDNFVFVKGFKGPLPKHSTFSKVNISTYRIIPSCQTTSMASRHTTQRSRRSCFPYIERRLLEKFGLAESLGATHLVMGIIWGTKSRIHIRWTSTTDTSSVNHSGRFDASGYMKKVSLDVGLSLENLKQELKSNTNVDFKAYGNLALQNMTMRSFADMENMIFKLPEYTRTLNSGKGSQLPYYLISLDDLKKFKTVAENNNYPGDKISQPLRIQVSIDTEMNELCSSMIFFHGVQQERLRLLNRNYQLILQNQHLLPDGQPERVKQQLYNITTIDANLHSKLQAVFFEARNCTAGAVAKFQILKNDYMNGRSGILQDFKNTLIPLTITNRYVEPQMYMSIAFQNRVNWMVLLPQLIFCSVRSSSLPSSFPF